jgi:zinc protease
LVTLSVALDAGEALLPSGSGGLAVLSGEGLEGGTAHRTGPELAEALERIGAGLSVRTSWNSTNASLTCLAEKMEEAGSLLAETLLESAFPIPEIDRLRSQRMAAIRQRRKDPSSLADDAAAHFFYALTSPYHRPLAGTLASVENLGSNEIREFVERRYRPSGSSLMVVGDVEMSEVERLALRWFGHWSGPPSEDIAVEVAPRYRERRVVVVDRPGSVQSEIRIGQVGLPRSTPLFFALKVFNTILGGAFTSRLMLNLREKRGFTYGVRSGFSFRKASGPFTISTAVATEVTAAAVGEAVGELEVILLDGPTREEVERARDYMAGVFPLHLETTGQIASRLVELHVFDLPDDYFSTYRDQIRAVTPEAALTAARASLDLDSMVAVVVGDADRVRGPLEDLGFGPVDVVTEF